MSTEPESEVTIALKYLELARAEILERLKLSNQFLIVYLGGISALLGWFYTAKDSTAHHFQPQYVLPVVAGVVSFLAFSLSWVLSENEMMIELLATYQRQELRPILPWPPMWEGSQVLATEKPHLGAMFVYALIINAPNIVLIGAYFLPPAQWSGCRMWITIAPALALSLFSILISFNMIRRRAEHRRHSAPPLNQGRTEPKL
jgi:hypothetical protein